MKWGRKKPSSFSSNSPLFPLSWISRFKKMSGNSESKPVNERGKVGKNLSSTRPSWNEGRFYGGDDEAYWRLSFGEERFEDEKKIRGGLKSVWYDSDEESNFPLSSSQCLSRRKVREFPQNVEILQRNDSCEGEIEAECEFEPIKVEQNRKMKEEENLKYEKQRKSVYINRRSPRNRAKQSNKMKGCSMRMAVKIECKIRALENKKKSKSKMKKAAKERTVRSKTAFDSFAVVKSSLDPEQDFVDSMVEMITEKGIRRPEELEELLACYLTLNHDEHHDLIIRVFRQVWFDLNRVPFDREVQCEDRCIL